MSPALSPSHSSSAEPSTADHPCSRWRCQGRSPCCDAVHQASILFVTLLRRETCKMYL